VDVVATTLRPASDGLAAAWLPNEPRLGIPGSVWLPNVGYGRLEPHIDAYFRANLERITGGDRTRCLLFYCKADCWMSWNAVRRAASYRYACLYWYRDGTDGWSAAGLPLEEAEPVPLPD
jgi:PQQ-dependent catabolism-associated CXXCW motif protein